MLNSFFFNYFAYAKSDLQQVIFSFGVTQPGVLADQQQFPFQRIRYVRKAIIVFICTPMGAPAGAPTPCKALEQFLTTRGYWALEQVR